jgi:hypothetical protein
MISINNNNNANTYTISDVLGTKYFIRICPNKVVNVTLTKELDLSYIR